MIGTVFVFGSINVDTSYRMATLPKPGETVVASSAQVSPGGKGANQAIAAAAAGAQTRMIGAVGADAEAAHLREALAAHGVHTGSIVTLETATGHAIVFVDESAENAIVVLGGANDELTDHIADAGLTSISQSDVLVLQNEVPAQANRAAARLAKAAGATVIWNAAPAPRSAEDLVRDIDLLVVNEHELKQLSALLGSEDGAVNSPANSEAHELTALLSACARALNTDAVCTLGSEGSLFVVDGRTGHVPAPKVQAIDTTAAGDTFVGYLAAHRELPVDERLLLAAAAGALAVTRAGASSSIPQLGDVKNLVAQNERTPA